MTFYHATKLENLNSILENGINTSFEGIVYLTKEDINSVKFLAIRGIKEIITIEIDIDESEVEETHDHSEYLFGKAYGLNRKIEPDEFINIMKWEL